MEKSYLEQYAELYRKHWWWRAREAEILREVTRLRSGRGPARILDVGCGDALLFDRLLPFGTVVGVEPEAGLVSETSRQKYRIHLSAFDDSFSVTERFDLILFLDVLEHLDAPAKALVAARDRLAPGGSILVTVPAYEWLWTSHDSVNHHRTRFAPSQLGGLAVEAGCRINRLRHLFMWLVAGKLAVRVLETVSSPGLNVPRLPHPIVNSLLQGACKLESLIARAMPLPVGSSILAVLEDGDRISARDGLG